MKGLIKLSVEIDYEKMLSEEHIESIQGFMGIEEKKELIQAHMSMLANKLLNIVNSKPYISSEMTGDVVEKESETKSDDDIATGGEVVDKIEDGVENQLYSDNAETIYNALKEAIDVVTMERGVIKLITFNDEMGEILKKSKDIFPSDAKKISNIMGYEARNEASEELAIINYRNYNTGERETLSITN